MSASERVVHFANDEIKQSLPSVEAFGEYAEPRNMSPTETIGGCTSASAPQPVHAASTRASQATPPLGGDAADYNSADSLNFGMFDYASVADAKKAVAAYETSCLERVEDTTTQSPFCTTVRTAQGHFSSVRPLQTAASFCRHGNLVAGVSIVQYSRNEPFAQAALARYLGIITQRLRSLVADGSPLL